MTKLEALQKSRIIWLAIAKESERRFAEGADPFVGKSWAYKVLGIEQQDVFLCPACQYTVDNSSDNRLNCTICPIWTEDSTRFYRCKKNSDSPYRQYTLSISTPKEHVRGAKDMVKLIDQRIAEERQ